MILVRLFSSDDVTSLLYGWKLPLLLFPPIAPSCADRGEKGGGVSPAIEVTLKWNQGSYFEMDFSIAVVIEIPALNVSRPAKFIKIKPNQTMKWKINSKF